MFETSRDVVLKRSSQTKLRRGERERGEEASDSEKSGRVV